MNTLLADVELPRVGHAARECRYEDAGYSPERGEASEYHDTCAGDAAGKNLLNQKAYRYPCAAHVGNIQHASGILGLYKSATRSRR